MRRVAGISFFVISKAGILTFIILLLLPATGFTFGFHAHRQINRMAVFTLPPEMIGLYKHHIEFVAERSIDPDRRAHAVEGEAPRHYIDIDHFGEDPFAVMPRNWEDAVEQFTEDTLMTYGVLPWHIHTMMHRLTYAFKQNDVDMIILHSAHLGHYLADACTPLHTTKYYNGRTPAERGIHAFWESRLPELYAEEYTYFTGQATYISDPLTEAWDLVKTSHLKVDTIYHVFDSLMIHLPKNMMYAWEMRGRTTTRVYSRDFSEAFHISLNQMVERQMRRAALAAGNYWFTAWVNAGQPDLKPLERKTISQRLKAFLSGKEKEWEQVTEPAGRSYDE